MSKLASGLAFSALGSGAALTGAWALGAFGTDSYLPQELSKFEESNGGDCVQGLFPGIANMMANEVGEINTTDKVNETLFTSVANEKINGCLVIHGDKRKLTVNSQDKWKGTIRFLWAVKGENKGFIVFVLGNAENSGSAPKISWDGAAYELGKDNSTWSIKKKHPKISRKHFTKDSDDKHFAKPGEHLGDDIKNKTFWGFFDNKNEVEKICTKEECKSGTTTVAPFRKKWKWTGESSGSSHQLSGGTTNLKDGGGGIYDVDKGNMEKVVEGKQGKGEQQ